MDVDRQAQAAAGSTGVRMQLAFQRESLRAASVLRCPTREAIWLEHFGSHADLYDQYFRSRHRRILWRTLAEQYV